MPTYTYRREDGSVFDIEQRITEDPFEVCPTTGQKVKRIISGTTGLLFKGSGFYLTDYVKSGARNGDANASKSPEKSEAPASSKNADASKESKTTSSGTSSGSDK